MKIRVISDKDGKPYLVRYYLLNCKYLGFSIFLHHFISPDNDRALHDHPWKWALSLILSGGYIEQRLTGYRAIQRGNFNLIKPKDFHRIEALDCYQQTWSLFIAGPHYRDWGFLDDGKFIPHKEYLRDRG
jgi:hypothetical protein